MTIYSKPTALLSFISSSAISGLDIILEIVSDVNDLFSEDSDGVDDNKERIVNIIANPDLWSKQNEPEDNSVDYAAEYKKQTGKDLATGKYVTQ